MASRTAHRTRFRTLFFLIALLFTVNVYAQSCITENEPNDTPAQANPLAGQSCVTGTLSSGDQDAFAWTVSEEDARQRWQFELDSIRGELTKLEVFRVQFADNGTDVVRADNLYTLSTPNGWQVESTPRLFSAGTYILGLSVSGGEGAYSLAVSGEGPKWYFGSADYDSAASTAHTDAFEMAGMLHDSHEVAWTVSEELASYLWAIEVEAAVGEKLSLEIVHPNGEVLSTLQPGPEGVARITSLGVEAGTYLLRMSVASEDVVPFHLFTASQGRATSGHEIEPNDSHGQANALFPGEELRGVLASGGDWDYFRFTIDEQHATRVFDLETGTAEYVEVCLSDGLRNSIQCRTGDGANLPLLHLPEGEYGLSLRSRSNEDDIPYTLVLRDIGEPAPGVVVEPNDTADWAFPLPENFAVRAELYGEDTDFYRVEITGEPQLWRAQVLGDGVQELQHHTLAGRSTAQHRGAERLRLDNLYLLPGTHFFSVRGNGGEYALRLLALGAPDKGVTVEPINPNVATPETVPDEELAALPTLPRPAGRMEQEPNDDQSRAEQLTFLEPRVGLLATMEDIDLYRFFIPNEQRIRLQVVPPPGIEYRADVYWGSAHVMRLYNEPDGIISIDEWVPPGDYHLYLSPYTPSDEYYQVTLERLNPFDALAEKQHDYPDWFVPSATAPVPGGDAAELDVVLEFTPADTDTVAAFWPFAQQLDLVLHVNNPTDEQFELELDWHSTAADWNLELPGTLVLPPHAQERVHVPLHIGADAPDDSEVLTVRARNAAGAQQSAVLTLTPDSFAEPVNHFAAWSVPDELLGGVNAAWAALGAEVFTATEDEKILADRFGVHWLFDGMTPLDHYFFNYNLSDWVARDLEAEEFLPTVRLAGEEPAQVAGFLLNPLVTGNISRSLRDFAIYLSLDGVEYERVYEGSLSAQPVEQAFVLPEPQLARYARLELLSNHAPGSEPLNSTIYLGTFKVVTTPESAVVVADAHGLNLADPAAGGHIVWSNPPTVAHSYAMLEDNGKYPEGRLGDDQEDAEWVIAFLNNRAAQVSELQWFDYPGSEMGGYYDIFQTVEVSVSTETPGGPWTLVDTWDLTRDADGAVEPLVFDAPVWARYVRFRATGLTPRGRYDFPELLRIVERTPDDEYRSALGEWGHYQSVGPYEWLAVAPAIEAEEVRGNTTHERAAPLEPGAVKRGTVELDVREAWYRIDVPAGLNELNLTLTGTPNREFAYELTNDAGELVTVVEETTPTTVAVRAKVDSGAYWLRLYEPPRSVVITWDTSGSVYAALPVIYQALAGFAQSISPGVEEVNLMPFDSPFLLRTWSSNPMRVWQAVNDDPRDTSSSSGEYALLMAAEALADRPGKKAVILLTDGAVPREAGLWETLLAVKPQVFSSEITAAGDLVPYPRYEQQLMQDYASVNGGFYEHVLHQGDFDVTFRRAAAWLRRPSHYTVSVELRQTWEKASAWAEDELERAQDLGLIPEVLTGADLTGPVTRAEFAAVAVRVYEALTGVVAVPVAVNPFTDTDDPEVLKAFNTELAVGISATEFAPDALLNREQAATILTRVFKKVNLPGWTWADDANFVLDFEEPELFADDDLISGWARESVYFMAANGIITGTGGGKFTPRAATPEEAALGYANATREQALLLAVRLVESR